jgi:hypothetical protein
MLNAMGASNGAQKDVLFNNMRELVPGISQAKPDYYYGVQPELIHQQVREDLSDQIVPSTSTHLPAVPNFSMEAKGPLGTNREALLQACHYGTIGARAIQSLQNYQQDESTYDGRVSSISSIYNSGQLKMYGHSVTQPNGPGTEPHYYMHQLRGITMTDSKDAFLQGATVFKNAIDLTAEQRNAAIARANEVVQTIEEEENTEGEDDNGEEGRDCRAPAEPSDMMHSFDCSTSQTFSTLVEDEGEDQDESETSVDEVADCVPPTKRPSSELLQSHRQKRKTGDSAERSSTARSTGRRK